MTHIGFPHSDIHGSKLSSCSPWLFAGKHVLHRLLVPRHPSYALSSLTYSHHLSGSRRFKALSWSFTIVRCLVRFRDFVRHLTPRGVRLDLPRISQMNFRMLSASCSSLRLSDGDTDSCGSVEDIGIEPMTSALQRPRSPS